jgi:hypothetical protein
MRRISGDAPVVRRGTHFGAGGERSSSSERGIHGSGSSRDRCDDGGDEDRGRQGDGGDDAVEGHAGMTQSSVHGSSLTDGNRSSGVRESVRTGLTSQLLGVSHDFGVDDGQGCDS